MNEKFYLFKRAADGIWIFGQNSDCEHPAGKCIVIPSTDKTKITIVYVLNTQANVNKYDVQVTSFYKEDDTAYADFASLKAGYKGFFSETLSMVNPSGNILSPTGTSTQAQVRLTRPNDTVQYAANDAINSSVVTPVSLNLPNVAAAIGKGGYLMEIEATTNLLNLADGTVRLWFYKTEPAGLVGDNLPMVNDDNNTTKGRHYIDIKFSSLLSGSSVLIAQKSPLWNFICDAASKDMKLRLQTLTAFTPVANGWIDLSFTVTQQ